MTNATIEEDSKFLLIDWNVFKFRSIFTWEKILLDNKQKGIVETPVPADWSALNSLFANLTLLKVTPNDVLVLAVDGRKSWRKEIDSAYKANRKESRDSHVEIDWDYWFARFEKLEKNLIASTPLHLLQIDRLEADDIISYFCRTFPKNECIILSTDADYLQLQALKNVKMFSPISKKFKITKNPYKELEKKITKEVADNLITPIVTEEDYQRRKLIVNLLELPKYVDEAIEKEIKDINWYKSFNIDKLPYKSLIKKFDLVYNWPQDTKLEKAKNKYQRRVKVDDATIQTQESII